MKREWIQAIREEKRAEDRLNHLREKLHHLLLQELDRKGVFSNICFVGGTALHILFGLDRFSEDLDFSTRQSPGKAFDLKSCAQSVWLSMEAFGFRGKPQKFRSVGAVQSCFFAFEEIVKESGVTKNPHQKLLIKMEVDTRPPAGAVEKASPVTGENLYKIRHYDLPSLFSGKLHAVLTRSYTKGRDLYDFLWYIGRGTTKPNKILLENALEQTEGKKSKLTINILKKRLRDKFERIRFQNAKKDVAPFLSNTQALNLFEKEVFLTALDKLEI